jgi:hypothetical protein
MNSFLGKACPYCQFPIRESENILVCSNCRIPYHRDCWEENHGCTTFGCTGAPVDASSAALVSTSGNDFFDINVNDRVFCTRCGYENSMSGNFCNRCGNVLRRSGGPASSYGASQGSNTVNYGSSGYSRNTPVNNYYNSSYAPPAYQHQTHGYMEYAGFWRRVGAYLIDTILLYIGFLYWALFWHLHLTVSLIQLRVIRFSPSLVSL